MEAAFAGDLACSVCGYGIAARADLPGRCPMCGTFSWAPVRSRLRESTLAGDVPPGPGRSSFGLLSGLGLAVSQQPASQRAA
jgi:hypothetical protein